MVRVKSKATFVASLLVSLLVAGGLVGCKKDDDKKDDPKPQQQQPQLSVREMLIGDGNKRWFNREYGQETTLPGSSSVTVTLQPVVDCDRDDAIIFKPNGTVVEWFGNVPCEAGDLVNTEQNSGLTWQLVGDRALDFKDNQGTLNCQIVSITANRLHLRWTEGGFNTTTVVEQVWSTQ